MREALPPGPRYKWGDGGTERLSNFPEIIHPVNSTADLSQTQALWLLNSHPEPPLHVASPGLPLNLASQLLKE